MTEVKKLLDSILNNEFEERFDLVFKNCLDEIFDVVEYIKNDNYIIEQNFPDNWIPPVG